jgi:uncharacterized protein (DUF2249 family)
MPCERHTTIFAAFRSLPLSATLDIVSDHDPKPLYSQFQDEAPGSFSWAYAHKGSDVWRVSIQKWAPLHGAGSCGGVCGGNA